MPRPCSCRHAAQQHRAGLRPLQAPRCPPWPRQSSGWPRSSPPGRRRSWGPRGSSRQAAAAAASRLQRRRRPRPRSQSRRRSRCYAATRARSSLATWGRRWRRGARPWTKVGGRAAGGGGAGCCAGVLQAALSTRQPLASGLPAERVLTHAHTAAAGRNRALLTPQATGAGRGTSLRACCRWTGPSSRPWRPCWSERARPARMGAAAGTVWGWLAASRERVRGRRRCWVLAVLRPPPPARPRPRRYDEDEEAKAGRREREAQIRVRPRRRQRGGRWPLGAAASLLARAAGSWPPPQAAQ